MFEPISGILSIVSGIAGSITTSIVNYKMKKLELEKEKIKYDYELKRIDKETEAMVKEAEANIKITQATYEGQEQVIEAEAFKESMKQANTYLFKSSYIKYLMDVKGWLGYITKPTACLILILFAFVDILKAFIRPGVTLFELGIVTWLTYKCYFIMESMKVQIFTTQYAQELFSTIVTVILQLFLVVIGWWFASRFTEKYSEKLLNQPKNY